jgi:hypothetical protein
MPRTGIPRVNRPGSGMGAFGAYTDDGPPDRMIPFGDWAAISRAEIRNGAISQYTASSRTRRAMSWVY